MIVVGSPGTGCEASVAADLPWELVNFMELNLGSTASENVIEILPGAGPDESGAGTIAFGWACAKAEEAKPARDASATTSGLSQSKRY